MLHQYRLCPFAGARATRSLSPQRFLAVACVLFCSGAARFTSAQSTSVYVAMPSPFCVDSAGGVSVSAEGGAGGNAGNGHLVASVDEEVGCCGSVSACLSVAAGGFLRRGDEGCDHPIICCLLSHPTMSLAS